MSKNIEYCNLLTVSARTTYNSIGSIYCPALKEKIVFNARGFHHLLYESCGTPRKVIEKIYKLTLLPLALPTIKNATEVVEERKIKIRANRKKNSLIKDGVMYTLVAKVGRKKPVDVRVIILRIGNGNFMFRSIMKN